VNDTQTATTTGEWARAHLPVVVGVDGSHGSLSALVWAATEAAAAGADLRVVTTVSDHASGHTRRRAEGAVAAWADQVSTVTSPEHVVGVVVSGSPERALLEEVGQARMVVVGKRGLGAIPRLLVGSTSLWVAGRSPVPVAVVPTAWDQASHGDEPVVVGLDPERPHHQLLHLAFRRAHRLRVPLVVVHGWEPRSSTPEEELESAESASHSLFETSLQSWRDRFPEVEVLAEASSHHPAMAVLAAMERGAQLAILGRHGGHRFAAFGFGSVTRAVLHYAEVPVLVVPNDD
jgi:nucleotide-binding universal stress UspA family protein